jgi:hypothetical protein
LSLFGRDDLVVTPHLAGATCDNFELVLRCGIDNVIVSLQASRSRQQRRSSLRTMVARLGMS